MQFVISGTPPVRECVLNDIFELRAKTFDSHLQWDVQTLVGREIDHLDDKHCIYGATYSGSRITSCFRLRSTAMPTLMDSAFAKIFPNSLPAKHDYAECSRFCVDQDLFNQHGLTPTQRTSLITYYIGSAMYQVLLAATEAGFTRIYSLSHEKLVHVLNQLNINMTRISPPTDVFGVTSSLGYIEPDFINLRNLQRLMETMSKKILPIKNAA